MKKILHLITSLEGGGTENFLHQILANSPAGYTHLVLYLKKDGVIGERLRQAGIAVRPAGSMLALYQTLHREKPDLLHTCLYSAHQIGRVLGTCAGIPAIITSQRSIDIWQQPWQGWLDTLTLPWTKIVMANSHAAAQVIEKRRGSQPLPEIVEIPNGVDPKRFVPMDRSEARRRYGLPSDTLVGGSLMRLHREKGADFLPHFAEKLLPAFPNLHLLVGGIGPLEKNIQDALAGTSYRDRIHWTGWEENTPAFLSASDFVWSLSREESFPQALVEASMMGLPWVAPDTGGVSELISAGAAGLTYTRLNIPQAAEQAAALVQGLPGFSQKARLGVPLIQTRYSLASMVSQVYKIFERFPLRVSS